MTSTTSNKVIKLGIGRIIACFSKLVFLFKHIIHFMIRVKLNVGFFVELWSFDSL